MQSTPPGALAIPAGIFTEKALDVHPDSPANYSFTELSARRNLSISVANPQGAQMTVYIALYRHHKWNMLGRLGEVEPGESRTFTYPLNFTYHGRTAETDMIGIVGRVGDTYTGNVIHIGEDWAPYEGRLQSMLAFVGIPLAGLLVGILAIVIGGVYSGSRHEHVWYSAKALTTGPAGWLARVITSPSFWLLEVACGVSIVLIILSLTLSDFNPGIGWLIFLVGGASAVFMPVVYLVAAWAFRYYRPRPFGLMASMFMWGVMAALLAFLINSACTHILGMVVGKNVALLASTLLTAPIVEEMAKGTGVLALSGRREFRDTLDGLLYGFAVGMGFAFIENWLYFTVNQSPVDAGGVGEWAYDVLYRSVFGSLGHGCFTAAVGGFIGYFKTRQAPESAALKGFVIGLPVAMILHSLFNLIAALGPIVPSAFGIQRPLFNPLLALIILAFYACLGVYVQAREKRARPE